MYRNGLSVTRSMIRSDGTSRSSNSRPHPNGSSLASRGNHESFQKIDEMMEMISNNQ